MDKLPEPEYQTDPNWRRLFLNIDKERELSNDKFYKSLFFFFVPIAYKYTREVTYYKHNYLQTLFILSGVALSSYFISLNRSYSPFLRAAEVNNTNELEYIKKYKSLYKEIKQAKGDVPDELVDF